MSSKERSFGGWRPRQPSATVFRSFAGSPTISFTVVLATAIAILATLLFSFTNFLQLSPTFSAGTERNLHTPIFEHSKANILSRCAALKATPGPTADFFSRDGSDRYEPGTNATLIRNCVIFTGKDNGTQVIRGDLFLDKGVIKGLGDISAQVIASVPNLTIVNADGAWVTPGLVDMHTHLGVLSTPILAGAIDLNSNKGPIVPWLRSLDGLNTHDDGYELAMAGGVTSVQVLPGSINAIGGQAFVIKLRKTKDRSPSSMIVDPPNNLNIPSDGDNDFTPFRWRHLKQACGENLRVYGNRMDTMWSYRSAYIEASKIKQAQDEYCARAESGLWDSINTPYPENGQYEVLVDVLRGRVKVSTHCYEAVDLDALVRLTNEFQFSIASVHHASEAWLVPDVIKRMWGKIPTIALFATNHRYKRESYRGSEFAARVLADEGIPVAMKSDHPVLNSRYVLYEAQQAHYFGLPDNLALAAVTSTPAVALGLSHRIGILSEGSDADVVLWDSHPLRLGATPRKVWIDGILQIPIPSKTKEENYVEIGKGKEGDEWKQLPTPPNWDKERNESIKWDGLPPLQGRSTQNTLVFTNVKQLWKKTAEGELQQSFHADSSKSEELGTVIVEGGKVTCVGRQCATVHGDATVMDLRGGVISPGLMTYGSPLGLEEIASEPSTADGVTYDAFASNVPKILDDSGAVVRAMDALVFSTRNALIAYRSGVTLGTASLARPIYLGGPNAHIIAGLSVTFRTGAGHAMQRGAIIQEVAALHIVMGKSQPALRGISVSTQMAGLRRLLYGWESRDKETGYWFRQASEASYFPSTWYPRILKPIRQGIVPLVIEVDSADIMANLLILKLDVEDRIGSTMRMVFSGAAEAHLLAKEISHADVGVILNPSRPYPMVWDQRRILPGPPLTNDTALVKLLENTVTVGLGVRSAWEAQNTRFDLQWAALESNEHISESQAYQLATTNLEKLLGVREIGEDATDLVVYEGGSMFELSSKVVGVISPVRGCVDLF